MDFLVTTEDLTKTYKNTVACDQVNLHLPEGKIYGLIGRNGAGKTTLIKMLAGLAFPTSGTVRFGKEHLKIGVLVEEPGIFPNLSAYENMEIKRRAMGLPDDSASKDLLSLVGLGYSIHSKVKTFSFGMVQRLGIALALLGEPDLLLLDEPMNGLDPAGMKELRDLLFEITRSGKITVLISSHLLDELSKMADIFGIMNQGALIEETTMAEIQKRMGGYIRLIVDPMDKTKEVLSAMGIYSYQTKSDYLIHVLERLSDSNEILKHLLDAGVHVSECRVVYDSLEDFFMQVTGGEKR